MYAFLLAVRSTCHLAMYRNYPSNAEVVFILEQMIRAVFNGRNDGALELVGVAKSVKVFDEHPDDA